MKNREGVVCAIIVTFRNYSDPAVPVDIFLFREKPVCPVSTVLAYLGLRGTSLEVNKGMKFHAICFSCYVINCHEGGQNMANHVLKCYS